MTALSLPEFQALKRDGFPLWPTAVDGGGMRYVEPVDCRYGAPAHPFGEDPAASAAAFEAWCAAHLRGDHFIVAGSWSALVYCRAPEDVALLERHFAATG